MKKSLSKVKSKKSTLRMYDDNQADPKVWGASKKFRRTRSPGEDLGMTAPWAGKGKV